MGKRRTSEGPRRQRRLNNRNLCLCFSPEDESDKELRGTWSGGGVGGRMPRKIRLSFLPACTGDAQLFKRGEREREKKSLSLVLSLFLFPLCRGHNHIAHYKKKKEGGFWSVPRSLSVCAGRRP